MTMADNKWPSLNTRCSMIHNLCAAGKVRHLRERLWDERGLCCVSSSESRDILVKDQTVRADSVAQCILPIITTLEPFDLTILSVMLRISVVTMYAELLTLQ